MVNQFKSFFLTFTKKLTCIIICVILLTQLSYAQTKKTKLQKNKMKIEQEIQFTNKILKQTKKNKQISLNQLVILKNRIKKREELITNINQEITVIVNEISITEKNIEQLNQELAALKAEYAQMIIAANRNRNSYNILMFVFASESFNQAYQRLKYYQQYSVYRKTQIKLIEQTQEKLEQKKRQLEVQKLSQKELLSSNETEKKQLAQEQDVKNQAVRKLQKKEKSLRKTLRRKEAEAKKLKKAIERIIAEEIRKAREAAALRAKKAKGARSANIMAATPEELKLSDDFTSNKGRLPWPSKKGIISSTFGTHSHPELPGIVINNDGIDITTNRGANARSIFNGKVTAVISGPNGKEVVIIRHGNYLTVYSNLEKVFVKRGEKVTTKQNIGIVYTDTEDNKTILQFQVWKGNSKMNPANWIAR